MRMSTAAIQHPDGFCRLVHGARRWFKVIDSQVAEVREEHGHIYLNKHPALYVDDLVAEDWHERQMQVMPEPVRILHDDPNHLSVFTHGGSLVVRVPTACTDIRVGEGLDSFVGRHGGLRGLTSFLLSCKAGTPLTNRGIA